MKSEEIAQIAGVSRSTVSRVINDYKNVPKATRDKVMKIIEEHNYMPNSFARTLAGKKSNTIGLFFIVKEANKNKERIFKNEFFTTYLELLVDFASLKNYYVLVSIISDESEYDKINQAFLEKRIDGGIIIGTQQNTLKGIKAENIKAPLVIFDYQLLESEKESYKAVDITVINSNDEPGIEQAVSYLVKLGHSEIGFIRGFASTRSGQIRFSAFQKAMNNYGLSVKKEYLLDGSFQMQATYQYVKSVIRKGELPTAYICANDCMAIGAMSALQENGIEIPKDISIIGFDNTQRSTEIVPKLTTIGLNYQKMAQKAIEILDKKINKSIVAPEIIQYDVNFIERDSCSLCKNLINTNL